MKKHAIGLIAEFNPFHNGHEIFINKAKSIDKDAVLVCIMSPNFVQRGEPSIEPKYNRVLKALENGIDLVIELPTIYAVESANIFASAAVNILNQLKVEDIVFGSETGDTKEFLEKFDNKQFQSPRMDELIDDFMDQGLGYPAAKSKALEIVSNFYLENPNDILGYEYLRTIRDNNYPININTYKRINDEKNEFGTSALAIRTQLKNSEENRYNFRFLEDYFNLLKYRLTTFTNSQLNSIHLLEEGIENLFIKNIYKAKSMDEFIELCTSKRYSRARIKRSIIHILLNTTKEEADDLLSTPPCLRVLGFNDKGSKYMRYLNKEFETKFINRFSAQDNKELLYELKATSLYFINESEPEYHNQLKIEMTKFPINIKK